MTRIRNEAYAIVEAARERGLNIEVRPGTAHDKVFVDGRMISILSRSTRITCPRSLKNLKAQIKRIERLEDAKRT